MNRCDLTKATKLLEQMNVPIPILPLYDPTKDEKFPRETSVAAVIKKLRAEKKAKKRETD